MHRARRTRHRRAHQRACRAKSPTAVPFSEDRVHASYDRRLRQPLLARAAARARGARAFPHRLSRQGEPGAFLLGQLRSGGDALFRAARAAPSRRRAASARRRRARGLFARGVERGLLAGPAGPVDYPAFYSYAYPAPEGFAAAQGAARRRRFSPRSSANSSCPTTRCARRAIRDAALMEFLQSTYEAAADLAQWDRAALECGLGEAGK